MDASDLETLRLLPADNRMSSADVGRAVGLSISATNERIRRLNSSRVIRGNHAILDPDKVDLPLCAFVFIGLSARADEEGFRGHLAGRQEVQEVQQISGSHSYLLKVRVSGPEALRRLLSKQIKSQAGVLRVEVLIVLETVKDAPIIALVPPSAKDAQERLTVTFRADAGR